MWSKENEIEEIVERCGENRWRKQGQDNMIVLKIIYRNCIEGVEKCVEEELTNGQDSSQNLVLEYERKTKLVLYNYYCSRHIRIKIPRLDNAVLRGRCR